MPLTARFGQIHLALAFAEPGAVFVGVFADALVALAAAFIFGALLVLR